MAAAPSLEATLRGLVQAARRLASCRYAAVGVPDGSGGFSHFITDGMSDELIAAIGPLPRTHGLLGAMLERPLPHRTADISRDPRFEWWPAAHPRMRSFLGVPIVSAGEVVGAFYLTDKIGADEFSDADQELIELFAAHAAVAIATARVHERSRELSVVEERNRLARDLHDAVSQTLFSLTPHGRGGGRAGRPRPGRRARPARRGAPAGRRGPCRDALAGVPAAAGRPRGRRPRGDAAKARRGARPRPPGARRDDRARRCDAGRGHRARALPDRPGGAAERAQALGRRPHRARARPRPRADARSRWPTTAPASTPPIRCCGRSTSA